MKVTKTQCPYCDHKLDSATDPKDERQRPSPGDLSICLNCSQVLIFDEQLVPCRPSNAQANELEKLPTVKKYQELIRTKIRRRQ